MHADYKLKLVKGSQLRRSTERLTGYFIQLSPVRHHTR